MPLGFVGAISFLLTLLELEEYDRGNENEARHLIAYVGSLSAIFEAVKSFTGRWQSRV